MLHPSGFTQQTVMTSLGPLVYYTAETVPWLEKTGDRFAANRPTLVFLHGFGGGSSAYEWAQVYPAFALDYRIVAPDLLGWGRSHHLSRQYEIDDYLVTIREFLQQVSDRPVTVIASSLTAAMMVRVAIESPELINAMILTAPTGLSDFGQDYNERWLAQVIKLPILDRLIYGTAIATSSGIRSFLENRQFARANRVSQEMVDAYLASAKQPLADYSALSFVRGNLCFDLATYMPQLTTPTAILWGKQAQFTRYDVGQQLAELNPKAVKVFQLLDEVGLTPQLEVPAVTISMIRRLLVTLGVTTG